MHLTTQNEVERKKRKHDRHAHLELLIEVNIYVGINVHAHELRHRPLDYNPLHELALKGSTQKRYHSCWSMKRDKANEKEKKIKLLPLNTFPLNNLMTSVKDIRSYFIHFHEIKNPIISDTLLLFNNIVANNETWVFSSFFLSDTKSIASTEIQTIDSIVNQRCVANVVNSF